MTEQSIEVITVEDSPVEDVRWRGIKTMIGEDGLKYSFDENEKQICGAKKKDGGPCRQSPITGRNRCRLHGGKSPRGIAHPRFQHGMYSRDLVGKAVGQRYEAALKDEKLIQLRDDIAIATGRIGQILERIENGESAKSWMELQDTYKEFLEAHRKRDLDEVAYQIRVMGRIIQDGLNEHLSWQEVFNIQGHKRRMIETERKRMSDMKQMMTSEQAMSMLAFVVSVVKKRVRENVNPNVAEKLLAEITQDITRYMADKKHYTHQQADE